LCFNFIQTNFVLYSTARVFFAYFHAPPRLHVEWQNAVATVKQVFPRKHVEHRVLPPRFSTRLPEADRQRIYPLLSHAVHRKSRWTLRFAKIAWASEIYVLLLILSYIYIYIFEEQTNKDVCILEIALVTNVGLERMFELSRVGEPWLKFGHEYSPSLCSGGSQI